MTTDQTNQHLSPFVVGVSGHRDLHPHSRGPAREALTAILRDLRERLPDSELRMMAGMATGADLLAVQTALELGIGIDAVLPMPVAHYAADFDPDSLRLLKTVLAHPQVRCIELPLGAQAARMADATDVAARTEQYQAVSQTLIRGSSLLIALWDGQSSNLPAGTADTVLRYLGVRTEDNRSDTELQFQAASAEAELPARVVYWIPTARVQNGVAPASSTPCFLAGLSDNTLLRVPVMPRRLQVHLHSLNDYNREFLRLMSRRRRGTAADSLFKAPHSEGVLDARERTTLERIDAEYGKADALALYFQRRSDSLFAVLNLVAFTLGLAYLTYEKLFRIRLLLFGYLLILIASASLYYLLHQRRWFAKHLMCRALAETLRVKFYLRLASGEDLVDAEEVFALSHVNRFHGFGWIGHVLIALASPSVPRAERPAEHAAGVESWIDDQCRYFVRKVARLQRSAVRTKWLKRSLFGVILVVVVLLLSLSEATSRRLIHGVPVESILTFIMGTFAVALASWELHQNKMAARELLWQYRNQLKHFTRARLQLGLTAAAGRRLEILAALGKDSLMESYLWTIHRFHREHEPPGAG
jgi:hypothetical protein